MRSISFENFLQEFNASGKEKIDGYTLGYFDSMTDAEKNHAFNLLNEELQNSAVAIDPMYYINKSEACTRFEHKYLAEKKSGHINFHLLAKLWSCQKEDIYAEEFAKCYNSISEHSLIAYINDSATIDNQKLNEVLVKIILNSHKEHVRRHAAKVLASKVSIIDESGKKDFINAVIVENLQARKLALRKILDWSLPN